MSDNPCVFKRECRKCNLCNKDDRPTMCKMLECEHYTPCAKCGRNMQLDDSKKCRVCNKTGYVESLASGNERISVNTVNAVSNNADALLSDIIDSTSRSGVDKRSATGDKRRTDDYRKINITAPGIPPQEYNESERKYYMDQWSNYSNYYRDPTVYPLIHNLIILEVELNYITFTMIGTRGEYHDKLIRHRTDLIKNMTAIRDQLPSEESFELSEDEKALSIIYETYKNEVEKRSKGKIKRLFDLPTIALAPNLHFKKDLSAILKKLGYKQIDIDEVVKRMKDYPEDPYELALFLGFPLDEEVVEENEDQDSGDMVEDNESNEGIIFSA